MPLMDSLSKIAKSVGDGAKTAVKKSEDMVEIAKLNKAISTEEDKIKLIYIEIGKSVLDKFENGENVEDDLREQCLKIKDIQENIHEIKSKIAEIKNCKICHNCGNELGMDTDFCDKCGAKQPERMPQENVDNVYQENSEESTQVHDAASTRESEITHCPSCGSAVPDNAVFCSNCGAKVK